MDNNASQDLLQTVDDRKFATILADPPWQFTNRTGKMAPEHKRLQRYPTMSLEDITHDFKSTRKSFLIPEPSKSSFHYVPSQATPIHRKSPPGPG